MQVDIPKKNVGYTFIDYQFRRWKVIYVANEGGCYDCQFVEYLDGFIKDTPNFKLFNFDDELFVQEDVQADINEIRSRPIDPAKLLRARQLLDLLRES